MIKPPTEAYQQIFQQCRGNAARCRDLVYEVFGEFLIVHGEHFLFWLFYAVTCIVSICENSFTPRKLVEGIFSMISPG